MTSHETHLTRRQLQRWLYRLRQHPGGRRLYRDSERVDAWLQRAGLPTGALRSFVAVDLTEVLMAADDIKRHARALLKQDPGTKRGARAAARHATAIEAALSGQLLENGRRLNKNWSRGVTRVLYARADKRGKPKAAA